MKQEMKKLALLMGVVFAMTAGVVSGKTEILPMSPTQFDVITITVSSTWGSSCVPNISNVDVDGNDIFFEAFTDYPPGYCLQVITPWELTEDVGPLPAGTYTIHASANDNPVSNPYIFGVSNKRFVLSTESLGVPEGATATFTVALLNDPLETVEAAVAYQSGDPDITVASGALLTFDPCNYSVPQTVTLAAAEDNDYLSGQAMIKITATDYVTSEIEAYEDDNDIPLIIYVDTDAPGSSTGTNWTNAFTDLQEALSVVTAVPEINEIRVAQGIYTPTGPGGKRHATFQLINGVTLKGGYAGLGEPDPDAQDASFYKTILSGDLNGDDGPNFTNRDDNSFHVVKGSGTGATTVLDGFTITAGGGTVNSGGIDLIGQGSPTIRNCIISYNRANYGAGIRTHNGSPTLINCMFIGNEAKLGSIDDGGGMYISGNGAVTLTNCIFIGNLANETGGGLYNNSPDTVVTNCIFWNNSDGGGTDESAQIHSGYSVVNYSCIQGWTGNLGGLGNIDVDPFFVDPGYWNVNNVWVEGDYHLFSDSPCIDAGDPSYVAGPDETDLDGNPRIANGRIDMGAYEFNHIPIADAGPDQTAYACIDGIAEVTLDGSDSNDIDGDQLSYYWSWMIDDQIYDANGVSPTIELPVGEHVIELIVNDGIEDSEPNEVVITVIDSIDLLDMLADDVIDLNLRRGIENGLLAKIDAAIAKLEDDNPKNDRAAVRMLRAFIRAVKAQSGKKIDENDAAELIETAQQIIDMLIGDGVKLGGAGRIRTPNRRMIRRLPPAKKR